MGIRFLNISGIRWLQRSLIFLILHVMVASTYSMGSGPEKMLVIRRIVFSGNAITKTPIMLRELVFNQGDTVVASGLPALLEVSRQNLLNTSLFNFVTIGTEEDQGELDVMITVVERWYIWPAPILEFTDRNFNSWWKSQDFTRVNFGFRINWNNFRGRMENLNMTIRSGKNQEYGVSYLVPYIDRQKRWGIGFSGTFDRERERGYLTENNKLKYLYDKKFLIDRWNAGILVSYRRSIYTVHQLSLDYEEVKLSDSLTRSNPAFFYQGMSHDGYFSLYYKLKVDHRDARYYPLSGWYTDVELMKSGIPGSQVDIGWIKSTNRIYLPLSKKWFYATSITGKLSSRKQQPYYFMRGLGYDREFVRGYEYYVVDGKHYLLSRNSLKFSVLPERSSTIPFIPTPKFGKIHYAAYLSANLDGGYVWEGGQGTGTGNTFPESLLIGGGVGLDIVTYYDKVMRVEYSFNRSGESGIFIHFIAGI